MIEKIVSGGQTGVDRAALDVAIDFHLDYGGWCPSGRRAEDGKIHRRYGMAETPSADYDQRTEWNVRDCDGVLILARGTLRGGTMLTKRIARKLGRPCLVANPNNPADIERVILWLSVKAIKTVDIAGPRESQEPGIYEDSRNFLTELIKKLTGG